MMDVTDEDRDTPGITKVVSSLPVDHSGTFVYLKGWLAEASPWPPIVIVHDIGEQADLYQDTAMAMVSHGYSTYAFDLRGHGRSGRLLGHAPSFRTLVKDLLQVAAWVRHREQGRAPIILGHGVGALMVMEFTKHHGNFCEAAILSAPCLEPMGQPGPISRLALRALAEVWPTLRVPDLLCPSFAKSLRGAQRLTAASVLEILMAIKRAETRFIEYHGQVLIICPEKDQVTVFHQLRKAAALHTEHNLQLSELPGTGHQTFTSDELTRATALAVIIPWLERLRHPSQSQGETDAAVQRLHGAFRADLAAVASDTMAPAAVDPREKPGASASPVPAPAPAPPAAKD